MDPREQQRAILVSWARLSAAETEAIESGNWTHLGTLHQAKQGLQRRLEATGDMPPEPDPEWQSGVVELLERERANLTLLARRRAVAEEERASVEQVRRNLRRQLGSFGHRSATSWQKYS